MRLAGILTAVLWLACVPAHAETLVPTYVEDAPTGHQKVWHATLDLRELPAGTRPSSIGAVIDLPDIAGDGGQNARVTISINGMVVSDRRAAPGRPTEIRTDLDDRVLSVRNHVAVAVTSFARDCPQSACTVTGARLAGPIRFALSPAAELPITFSAHVTRFRQGVALRIADPRDRALAERVIQALAPHAPRTADGHGGGIEVIVGHALPAGVSAPVRFDTGAVGIADRDGRVLYDRAALDTFTLVQIAHRGEAPVLWVRPGTGPLAAGPLELDYGNVALFGPHGREIAFSPDQDHSLTIAYAADATREARVSLYWRLGIVAVWLAITAGLAVVLRRMPPLRPAALEPAGA